MLVKSKLKRSMYLWIFFIFLVIISPFSILILEDVTLDNIWFIMLGSGVVGGLIFWNINITWSEISLKENGVQLTRFISRKVIFLYYDQLDGYSERQRNYELYGKNQLLFIIKNGKKIHRIPSVLFLNYDEIKSNLSLKYLGVQKMSFLEKFASLLGFEDG